MPHSQARTQATLNCILLVAVVLLAFPASNSAANDRSDTHALDRIYGTETLAENLGGIRRRVAQLAPQDRYEELVDYVLPSAKRPSFRFAAAFAPTPHEHTSGAPIERLLSAVFDLIDVAKQAGRLDELRTRVAALKVEDEVEQRQQIALLALVEIARSHFEAALPLLDEMETRLRATTFPHLADRWPETLLLSVAVDFPPLHDAAESIIQRVLSDQVRAGHHAGPVVWDVHMLALLGRLRYLRATEAAAGHDTPRDPAEKQHFGEPPRLTQWHPVSAGDEATYAQGFPVSHWHRFDDRVEKLSGHRDEYLYFCSPLQGDFQVECDITGFHHREGQLAVGGDWIWLHHSHKELMTGGLRGQTGTLSIEPRLSEVNDWVHYRSVVKDCVCREFVNGRLLLTRPLRETQFPWLAIRSPYWASTSVRDIRLTGSPTIPDRISLSSDPELSGWVRYHLDSVGGPTDDWRFDKSLGPDGGISARRKVEYSGMFQESLLRYHRPLLEDGVIEYEFEYQPGRTNVAPAIGHRAFLIEPDGIRLHQITNGVWDTTGLDPLNRSDVMSNASSATAFPLQTGWNALRLIVRGNQLSVELNRQPVLKTALVPNNDAPGEQEHRLASGSNRMFGLFHFADQTDVRIRNMFWSGDWPKSLPPLPEQELKDPTVDLIDQQLAQLSDRVELDFAAQTVRSDLKNAPFRNVTIPYRTAFNIWPSSDGRGRSLERAAGLLMTRSETKPFNDTQIAVSFRTVGDFDFVAEFSDLKLRTPGDGNSAIYLMVVADDPLSTHRRVWHGVYAHPGIDRRRVTQIETNRYRKTGIEIQYDGLAAEDCDSGRLRIARIGSMMHFMIAEEDSPTFRLLHSTDAEDEPLKTDGIRLSSGTYDNQTPPAGGVQVTWKKLTLRADRLVPSAMLPDVKAANTN